ncbi:phage tail protein [Sapientia aquatica]|uniref:Phage tail protein n=1 Tax=Sapientia aquatica TaxID=1549640 RepID=A0A4R5W1S1_9BURK|nr:phage tail protein [Sapientia aquatica]TDK65974.1 phage tail protein [Sapientia aquatica]
MALYATLGDIEFDLLTYFDGFEIKFAANYAEHALIGRKPRLQFVGDALDEIKLDCRFDIGFCNPEAELLRLKAAQASHEAMALTFGNGDYKGRFVITELPATARQTDMGGTLQSVEATLTLREFVGDGRSAAPPAVVVAGTPLPLPTELTRRPAPPSLPQISASLAGLPPGAPLPRVDGLALGIAQTKATLSGAGAISASLDQLKQAAANTNQLASASGALSDVQRWSSNLQTTCRSATATIGAFAQLGSASTIGADAGTISQQLSNINSGLGAIKSLSLNASLGGQIGAITRQLNTAGALIQSPLAALATHVILRH